MKTLKIAAPLLGLIALGTSPLTTIAADTTTKQEVLEVANATQSTRLTATIEALDTKSRNVKLKGPEGNIVEVKVSDEVKNLSEFKVGDKVEIDYKESIVVALKPNTLLRKRIESTVVTAPEGQQTPGTKSVRKVYVVASVLEVNKEKQTVRLRGPKKIVEVKVRDPQLLEKVKEGDMVEATYVEGMTTNVIKQAAAQ